MLSRKKPGVRSHETGSLGDRQLKKNSQKYASCDECFGAVRGMTWTCDRPVLLRLRVLKDRFSLRLSWTDTSIVVYRRCRL